jgi:hypothetical protein
LTIEKLIVPQSGPQLPTRFMLTPPPGQAAPPSMAKEQNDGSQTPSIHRPLVHGVQSGSLVEGRQEPSWQVFSLHSTTGPSEQAAPSLIGGYTHSPIRPHTSSVHSLPSSGQQTPSQQVCPSEQQSSPQQVVPFGQHPPPVAAQQIGASAGQHPVGPQHVLFAGQQLPPQQVPEQQVSPQHD